MRDELVAATSTILQRDGLAKLSTRAVAREAGVSEGALYKHFATKEDLVLAAIHMLVAPYAAIAVELPTRVGLGDIPSTLEALAVENYRFILRAGPIWSSMHADPVLHQRYLALLRERDRGPQIAMRLLTTYCAAEQRLGRLRASLAPESIADTVMAVAHFVASLESNLGDMVIPVGQGEARVRAMVAVVLQGILP